MDVVILAGATAIIFLTLNFTGLKLLLLPLFDRRIGHLLAVPFRMGPAVLFYPGYVAGLLWFVSVPAFRAAAPFAALGEGALLGILAYGTYELSNYATLRDWSIAQVVVDMIWGACITAISAWGGVMIALALGQGQ